MDLQTALLAGIAGLASTVIALAGVIVFLYKREQRLKQSADAKIEKFRNEIYARQDAGEATCRDELKAARADISRLNDDVLRLSQRDRDMAIAAILLYAEKRESDRELIEAIADELDVLVPPADPNRRTTVQLKAVTGGPR